jgi:putative nucleotidyltransferase with HDIG domain
MNTEQFGHVALSGMSGELLTAMATRLLEEMARRDPVTYAHSERVARIAVGIGEELHLNAQDLEDLRLSALLHDIGKSAVRGSLLQKPDKLSNQEYARIKGHTEMGYELLRNIPGLERFASTARWHHERWDGTGYPDRLRGEATPRLARIVALADSVDVMLHGRSYQDARDPREVILEVRRSAGTHFDPSVVNALMSAWMGGLLPGFD